ncbi:MAG: hypothetical protein GEU95_03055 [Rhizobiales bacterium]|nr:hypothetical protein [Hyphomicrobiales bacterium]
MHVRWVRQIGFAGAYTLAALVIGAPAQAQDDAVEGNSIWNLEQRVWGGIVRGLGLKDPNAPQIEYRERSPLVVPPNRDLPPPQARPRPRDPDWPNDPDVARAAKANAVKRKTASNAQTAIEGSGRALTPSELEPAGTARGQTTASTSSDRSNAPTSGAEGRPVAPSELGYFGGLFSGRAWGFGAYQEETGTFTNEPPRSQLTEPPPGYQTPSPSQPYGVTKRIERSKAEPFDPAGRGYGR